MRTILMSQIRHYLTGVLECEWNHDVMLTVTAMNPKQFEPRILKVTKEALAEGVKVSEIAEQLAPLIGRSRFYAWVKKWEKQGKL